MLYPYAEFIKNSNRYPFQQRSLEHPSIIVQLINDAGLPLGRIFSTYFGTGFQ